MYIRRKVFSLLQDETGEERYFSTTDVTLEDAEERLYSINEEDLEQKEFARADYEGLTDAEKLAYKTERSNIAKDLLQKRKNINKAHSFGAGTEGSLKQAYDNNKVFGIDSAIRDANKKSELFKNNLIKSRKPDLKTAASNKNILSMSKATKQLTKPSLKLGKAGKIALGTAAAAGLAYGAKKLYDKKKKD